MSASGVHVGARPASFSAQICAMSAARKPPAQAWPVKLGGVAQPRSKHAPSSAPAGHEVLLPPRQLVCDVRPRDQAADED